MQGWDTFCVCGAGLLVSIQHCGTPEGGAVFLGFLGGMGLWYSALRVLGYRVYARNQTHHGLRVLGSRV